MVDTTPPVLISLTIPSTVDLTNGPGYFDISATANDDASGIDKIIVNFDQGFLKYYSYSSTIGSSYSFIGMFGHSDTWADGSSHVAHWISPYNPSGIYNISEVSVSDVMGNTKTYSTSELVTLGVNTSVNFVGGAVQDTTAPVLQSISLSQPALNITEGQNTLTVTAHFTDNLSGIFDGINANGTGGSSPQIRFRSPNGQIIDAIFNILQPISGNRLDGFYSSTITLGSNAEAGTWIPEYLLLNDEAGNMISYSPSNSTLLSNLNFNVINNAEDTVYSPITYALDVSYKNLTLLGPSNINGTGNALENILTGNTGNNILDGGSGNDSVYGAAGSDTAVLDFAKSAITSISTTDDGLSIILKTANEQKLLSSIENLAFTDQTLTTASLLQSPSTPSTPLFTAPNSTSGYIEPTIYTGAVSFLEWQLLGGDTGDVVIGAKTNDFISLGVGDDAANGGAGRDVLDGGIGSSFLTGGTEADTFFVDGRNAASTWSTITDFNRSEGDTVNMWGWRQGISQLITSQNDGGAAGYTGATYHYDLDGNRAIDTSITFAGLTTSQVGNPTQQSVAGNGYLLWA